jgi:hypothetical protein
MARQRQARTPGTGAILAWEDDPGSPDSTQTPIPRPVPNLAGRLPITIADPAPPAGQFDVGTPQFRYWAAAEALGRSAGFWTDVLPRGTKWFRSNGPKLPVQLDEDVDFNAFYDRQGLHFFHGSADSTVVFSGESPDVVTHELGHAILDAVRPQLFDSMAQEVAAFHEFFGDASAILSALQLEPVRDGILAETNGNLDRSSRISRLAEQLGWAIRQIRADLVDPDCLRNASNSFFYADPIGLPPSAPASQLSSEPHSFSRVFAGAFLEILAGMFSAHGGGNSAALLEVSRDLGQLLVDGIVGAPVVTSYMSQVAAHMIEADIARSSGKYRDALKAGFVRHGILSLQAVTAPPPPEDRAAARRSFVGAAAPRGAAEATARVALGARPYGLDEELLVHAATEPARFSVAGAAPSFGSVEPTQGDRAAASFVEDLIRRGRVDFGEHAPKETAVAAPRARKTHEVRREAEGLVLARRYFDCGFDTSG